VNLADSVCQILLTYCLSIVCKHLADTVCQIQRKMLLNCHTCYSLCYGTLSVEELMREIKEKDYDTFVLTDINNTSACLDTLRTAGRDFGLRPIVGIDFRNGVKQQYVGIAKNNEGFRELNIHLTRHLHEAKDFDARAPFFDHAYIIYPLAAYKGWPLKENEFVGVSIKDLPRLPFTQARHLPHKLVALQAATFASKQQFNAHRLLRAIDKNTLLSKLPAAEQATPDEMIIPKNQLYAAYGAYHSLIANTHRILGTCFTEFQFGKLASKNLKHYTHSVASDIELLRSECMNGLPFRYGSNPGPQVMQRLEKELEVIAQKDFASYYLINWDIVRYAQRQNYYYVGRGSGSNSLVAYLLRITDVDPIELDLYFERFINIHRNNAPDFDIDFSWTDRDDITAYIFNRFGRDRTALLATYSTFRFDAVTRELGKVFGLPPAEIDRLQANPDENKADQMGKLVLKYSKLIENFPSHLSVHASGILISEEPVTTYTATFIPPKGYPTTQFSMQEAEDIGLFKFDILSQRGLGKIKDALSIVKKNRKVDIDIHDVRRFFADEKIKSLLSVGKCIGCFYVESPAMRMLLAKLRADDYLRLVAASSIIRPGVARSGMMRAYILRYRNQAEREKARAELPELYDLLQETYGVMVYQEDVIKIAHFFAGLTLAEADHLRRGMSWKFKQRNEFWKVQQKFFSNCLEKGYSEQTTRGIWTQIESFANFAFSKGHSASYAVESYQALFLKAYYPIEYMVATLNNGGGFYRASVYIHEARMHGAKIMAPCVNNSQVLCDVRGETVYLGLGMIGSLALQLAAQIVKERAHGLYENLYDFIKRVPLPIEQLRLLIRAGAFSFMGKSKKELLWEAHSLVNPARKTQPMQELFEVKPREYKLPAFTDSWLDNAFDETELLGFSLCPPFLLLKDMPDINLTAKELKSKVGEVVEIIGYHVHTKVTQTVRGERMCFGTFLDTEGFWIDTVHFPPSLHAYPFRGPGCYIIKGKVVEEFDFLSIEVSEMVRIPSLNPEDDRVLAEQRAHLVKPVS
jgi:DNA polymerase III subunit alpha